MERFSARWCVPAACNIRSGAIWVDNLQKLLIFSNHMSQSYTVSETTTVSHFRRSIVVRMLSPVHRRSVRGLVAVVDRRASVWSRSNDQSPATTPAGLLTCDAMVFHRCTIASTLLHCGTSQRTFKTEEPVVASF